MTLAEQILLKLTSLEQRQAKMQEVQTKVVALIEKLPASQNAEFEEQLKAVVETNIVPLELIKLPDPPPPKPVLPEVFKLIDSIRGSNAVCGFKLLNKYPCLLGKIIGLRRDGYNNEDAFDLLTGDFASLDKVYHVAAILTVGRQLKFVMGQTTNSKGTKAYREFVKEHPSNKVEA
jgi:hypothetical protein